MKEERAQQKPGDKSTKSTFWPPGLTIFMTLVAFFGAQLIALFLAVQFVALLSASRQVFIEIFNVSWTERFEEVVAQFVAIVMIEALVVGFIWAFLRLGKYTFKTIGWVKPKKEDVLYALSGFGLYFLVYVVVAVIAQAVYPNLNLEQEQQLGFEIVKTPLELSMVFIGLVILPPIVEELLMRGFLYKGLRTKLAFWPTAIIVSVLFAIAHLQIGNGAPLLWVAALDTFALSLVLVWLRERTGRLAAPMLLHGLKNTIAFTLLFIIGVN